MTARTKPAAYVWCRLCSGPKDFIAYVTGPDRHGHYWLSRRDMGYRKDRTTLANLNKLSGETTRPIPRLEPVINAPRPVRSNKWRAMG